MDRPVADHRRLPPTRRQLEPDETLERRGVALDEDALQTRERGLGIRVTHVLALRPDQQHALAATPPALPALAAVDILLDEAVPRELAQVVARRARRFAQLSRQD